MAPISGIVPHGSPHGLPLLLEEEELDEETPPSSLDDRELSLLDELG